MFIAMPQANSKITMKKTKPKISVETLPNGYALTLDDNEYMYFDVEQLIAGFFTHVAVRKTEYLDKEMAQGILIAAASWKTVGDALEANASLIASARKANTEANIAERGQARANERADEAIKEADRLRRENTELRAKVYELEASIERIGKMLVSNHKPRQVMADADHMSRGRKQLVTGPKKKGKGRYARKE